MNDAPADVRRSDIAVATSLLFEMEESQKRLARSVEVHSQKLGELREVLDEWRTRRD